MTAPACKRVAVLPLPVFQHYIVVVFVESTWGADRKGGFCFFFALLCWFICACMAVGLCVLDLVLVVVAICSCLQ